MAKIIGCDKTSVLNWEKGHTSPGTNKVPDIRRFLGPIAKREKDVAGVVRKWIADAQKNDETENQPTFESLLEPHSRTARLV